LFIEVYINKIKEFLKGANVGRKEVRRGDHRQVADQRHECDDGDAELQNGLQQNAIQLEEG